MSLIPNRNSDCMVGIRQLPDFGLPTCVCRTYKEVWFFHSRMCKRRTSICMYCKKYMMLVQLSHCPMQVQILAAMAQSGIWAYVPAAMWCCAFDPIGETGLGLAVKRVHIGQHCFPTLCTDLNCLALWRLGLAEQILIGSEVTTCDTIQRPNSILCIFIQCYGCDLWEKLTWLSCLCQSSGCADRASKAWTLLAIWCYDFKIVVYNCYILVSIASIEVMRLSKVEASLYFSQSCRSPHSGDSVSAVSSMWTRASLLFHRSPARRICMCDISIQRQQNEVAESPCGGQMSHKFWETIKAEACQPAVNIMISHPSTVRCWTGRHLIISQVCLLSLANHFHGMPSAG